MRTVAGPGRGIRERLFFEPGNGIPDNTPGKIAVWRYIRRMRAGFCGIGDHRHGPLKLFVREDIYFQGADDVHEPRLTFDAAVDESDMRDVRRDLIGGGVQ